MDIDEALIGIHPGALVDSFLKSFQSENTGKYQVIFNRSPVPVDAGILACLEDAPCWSASPYLLLDAMDPEGCPEGVFPNAVSKPGSGGVVLLDNSILLTDEEPLHLD